MGSRNTWGWISVKPEINRIGLWCENQTLIWIRANRFQETPFFVKQRHTFICLCKLQPIKESPDFCLQLNVPPPYSLIESKLEHGEDDFALYVLRRTEWEPEETSVTEVGWDSPLFLLGVGEKSYMLNHCTLACPQL